MYYALHYHGCCPDTEWYSKIDFSKYPKDTTLLQMARAIYAEYPLPYYFRTADLEVHEWLNIPACIDNKATIKLATFTRREIIGDTWFSRLLAFFSSNP